MSTAESREEIAQGAYVACYEGLKASSLDALLAMNFALYPHVSHDKIHAMWAHHGSLEEQAEFLFGLECSGASESEIATEWVPNIDSAMDGFLVDEARTIGVDVEEERHDPYFVAEMLHEIRCLPEDERAAAVRAVNDGSTPADRGSYE